MAAAAKVQTPEAERPHMLYCAERPNMLYYAERPHMLYCAERLNARTGC